MPVSGLQQITWLKITARKCKHILIRLFSSIETNPYRYYLAKMVYKIAEDCASLSSDR
jgi:hypothetical protein